MQLLLANARDSWKSFRKEVESDPITVSVALAGGKAGEGRSFGGGTAVLGPENYKKPEPPKPMSGMGTAIDQALITRGVIGGSGFGPAVRPLPTASVNTVYGPISPGVVLNPAEAALIGQPLRTTTSKSTVAHTDREYRQYRVRAVSSGIMDPMSRKDYDKEGGFQAAMFELDSWNEARARDRSDRAMERAQAKASPFYQPGGDPNGPGPRIPRGGRTAPGGNSATASAPAQSIFPNLRGAFSAYAGIQFAGGLFASQNQLAYAQIGALGDRAAYAQASIDNNPLASAVGSIPLGIGGGIVAAADYISGGRIDATRTLKMAGIQDAVTASLRQRGDLMRTTALSAQYAGANAVGGFSAQMAGFQIALANVDPNRQLMAAQIKAPLQSEVSALSSRFQEIANGMKDFSIAEKGTEAAWGGTRDKKFSDLTKKDDGTVDLSQLGYTPSDHAVAKIKEYNDAQTSLNQAKSRMNSVDESTRKIAELEEKSIKTQMAIAKAFDRIDATNISLSSSYAYQAGESSIRGDTAGSIHNQIRGQFTPQISAAQAKIDAIKAEGGTVSQAQIAEVEALKVQQKIATQQAFTSFSRASILEVGGLKAGALGLAYKPFDAMRATAEAEFRARVTSIDGNGNSVTAYRDSDVYKRADAARQLALAQINQNQNYQRRGLDTSLDAQAESIQYRFARNPLGSQAAELVGGTINQMRDMTRAQFEAQGEKLRANTMGELDLMKRDYGLSFRGEQYDLQNMLVNNPRDAQNPSEVFKSIDDQKKKLAGADISPDKDEKTAKEIGVTADKIIDALPSILKQAFADAVAS